MSSTASLRLLLLATAVSWPTGALAQTDSSPSDPGKPLAAMASVGIKRDVGRGSNDPSLRSIVQGRGLGATFQATTKDKVATLKIAFPLGHDDKNAAYLRVSAPVSDGEEQTTVADLRELRSIPKIELGLRRVFWSVHQMGTPEERLATWRKGCQDNNQPEDCDLASLPAGVSESIVRTSLPVLIGLAGEAGNKTFSFLSPTSLEKGEARHTAFSMAGALGVFPAAKNASGFYYFGISGRFEEAYRAGTKAQVCRPIGATGSERCAEAVLGGPTKVTRHLGEIEARYYLGKNRQVLANPRLVRDFKQRTTGIELPVFFIRGADGGLNGGIALGWTSDQKTLTAMVFVGGVAPVW
jgi:hypothetical protein